MRLQYWVIQFVSDPLRGEGRNVAVIAHDGRQAHLRALGLRRNGQVDLSYFEALANRHAPKAWVYGEWVRWFQDLAIHEGQSVERLDAILNEMIANGIHFTALTAGTTDVPKPASPEHAMNWLFERLVGRVRRSPSRTFDMQIEDALARSKIALQTDFMRDIEVEILAEPDAPPVVLTFPFLLNATPRIGFKVVRPYAGVISYKRQVSDAVSTFDKAVVSGFLERPRCLVLTKKPSGGPKAPLMEMLSRSAVVVDIDLPDAWRVIHATLALH